MDSEPAEVEGEAAENGDAGDTGAELDDGTGPESSELGEGVTAHVKVKAKRSERWLLGLVVPSLFCTDLNTCRFTHPVDRGCVHSVTGRNRADVGLPTRPLRQPLPLEAGTMGGYGQSGEQRTSRQGQAGTGCTLLLNVLAAGLQGRGKAAFAGGARPH